MENTCKDCKYYSKSEKGYFLMRCSSEGVITHHLDTDIGSCESFKEKEPETECPNISLVSLEEIKIKEGGEMFLRDENIKLKKALKESHEKTSILSLEAVHKLVNELKEAQDKKYSLMIENLELRSKLKSLYNSHRKQKNETTKSE